ncbi:MAG: hypothetical protein WBQ26_13945 [Gemmatimonadaceae bacterium]
MPSGMVRTPFGLYPQGCVIEVPRGATWHPDGSVQHADGSITRPVGCAAAMNDTIKSSGHPWRPPLLPPADNGWIEDSKEYAAVGHTFREIDADWGVPSNPDSSYSGGDLLYTFPAIEDPSYILQPVLQWGYNNSFGGNYWSFTNWWVGAHVLGYSASIVYPNPGDSLRGRIVPITCGGGGCDWELYSIDKTLRDTTIMTGADFDDDFKNGYGGVLEVYGLTNCGQFPWGGLKFTSIALYQDNGIITPSWGPEVDTSSSPQCGFGVDTTATTAFLAVSTAPYQLVAPYIDGPTQIDSGTVGFWDADLAHAGEPPYTWWWTGTLFGSGSSLSGSPTESGYLTLHVVDQVPDTAADSTYVTVCLPRLHNCPEIRAGGVRAAGTGG